MYVDEEEIEEVLGVDGRSIEGMNAAPRPTVPWRECEVPAALHLRSSGTLH